MTKLLASVVASSKGSATDLRAFSVLNSDRDTDSKELDSSNESTEGTRCLVVSDKYRSLRHM